MRRVLLLVSGSGGGHIQAGKNVARALRELAPDTECVVKDSYDFLHPFKRWQYTVGWELLFQYFGPVYRVSRRFAIGHPWIVWRIRRSFVASARRFARWLEAQPHFDAVVATQPHGAGLMDFAKRQARWASTYLAQVWTDVQYYEMYHWPNVDRYFAPAEDVRTAAACAHPGDRVSVTGTPIDPAFAQQPDLAAVRQQFDLPDDGRPVVLITRGSKGYDATFTLTVLEALAQAHLPITIVANAGRNPALVARMREVLQRADPARTRHVLGWIDNMHELLAVTDLLVAKPGGLTVAEALARGVPLLAFRPIPGQEDANVAFLQQHRVGQLVRTPTEAVATVRRLIDNPVELKTIRARAAMLGFPDAAYRVARQILTDLAER